MSYLTTPELGEFSKATISFWFRVPQSSLDAAKAQGDADTEGIEKLSGLVPLIVFGKEGVGHSKQSESSSSTPIEWTSTVVECIQRFNINCYFPTGSPITSFIHCYVASAWVDCLAPWTQTKEFSSNTISYSSAPGDPVDPSYIAIDGDGNLQINFESTQMGNAVLPYNIVAATPDIPPGNGGTTYICYTISLNFPCVEGSQTSSGGVDSGGDFHSVLPSNTGGAGGSATVTYGAVPGDLGSSAINWSSSNALAADTWHHVLISVDMSGGSAATGLAAGEDTSAPIAGRVTANSLLYVAIDDQNIMTGDSENIFPGTNKVISGAAAAASGLSQATNIFTEAPEGPVPSYSVDSMSVPAGEVGIPSVGKYTDRIHQVEMAELQIFTGNDAVLDTGKTENRRLFITGPDNYGRQTPVNPSPTYVPFVKYAVGDPATWEPGADWPAFVPPLSALDPTNSASAKKDLGIAQIDFTKASTNWMSGQNLGTLRGLVEKTGGIRAYSPDPSIVGS